MGRWFSAPRYAPPPPPMVTVSRSCTPSTQACAKVGDPCTTAESCSSGLKYVYKQNGTDTVKCLGVGNICANPADVFSFGKCTFQPPQTPISTLPTTPTPTQTTPTNYIKHEGKVRWTSVNTDVTNGALRGKTLNQCKASCNQNAECAGFSRQAISDVTPASCWLKRSKGVETNGFSNSNNFNMYVKGGAPPQTPISTPPPPPPQTTPTPTTTTGNYTKIDRKANRSPSVRAGNAGWGTLDKCERDCDSRPACKGFIRHNINNSDGSNGSCWFLGQAGVTNIPNNTFFNTYVKGAAPPQTPISTPPPPQTTPTPTTTTGNYTKIDRKANTSPSVRAGMAGFGTLDKCERDCDSRPACKGFIRLHTNSDGSSGACWFLGQAGVTNIPNNTFFNTYVKGAAPTTAPPSYTYTKKTSWVRLTGPGTDVGGGNLTNKNLAQCKAECNKNTSCAGFSRTTFGDKCWLKTSEGVNNLEPNYLYSTYVKNENFEVFRPAGTPPPGRTCNGESNVTPWSPPHPHKIN